MNFSAQERKEFAFSFKPKEKGKSDKYSWRMYQRALKNGRQSVYLMAWNSINGYSKPDISMLKDGFVSANMLAVGNFDFCGDGRDWFHGATVRQICTEGAARHDWAFGPGHHTNEWVDVTDWFWSSYEKVGMCLFFKHQHIWVSINRNAKKCDYCGKHIRREIKKVQTIKRVEVWS